MLDKVVKEVLDAAINCTDIDTRYHGFSTHTVIGNNLTYIFKDKKRIIDISRYTFGSCVTVTLYDSSEFDKLDYIIRKYDEEYDISNKKSLTYLGFVKKYTADQFGTYRFKIDVVLP